MTTETPIATPQTPRLDPVALEARTQAIGRALHARMVAYRPSPSERVGDAAMLLLARDDGFRARLLRFIDALASLEGDRGGGRVKRLLGEYLRGDAPGLPLWLRALLPVLASPIWPAPVVALVARTAAKGVAARFISEGSPAGLRATLAYLAAQRRMPSFDILGEYVVSDAEADAYRDQYLELLRQLRVGRAVVREFARSSHAPGGRPHARPPARPHPLEVSVKLSSLTAEFNPADPAGTLARVEPRLGAIIEAARRGGVGVTLDMERYETRDLVLHIFEAIFGRGGRFAGWDGIGVVLQAYLRDAAAQAQRLLAVAQGRGVPFKIRLVKGAYWDYETVIAGENGWPEPVWTEKAETDRCFERLTERLIEAHPRVRLAVASHNLRSHAHAQAVREACGLPPDAVEHQVLYRTAEGIARALAASGWPVRDYVPLGDLLPGMAYLVRRILENSSQTGFLLQSRTGQSADELLAVPALAAEAWEQGTAADLAEPPDGEDDGFRNQPPARLFVAGEREAFARALAATRAQFGREYPLRLGDETVRTGSIVAVRDPSHPDAEPVGLVHEAGERQVERALDLLNDAAGAWAARPAGERAAILRRAADLLAARRPETAAWIVHEAAKVWPEALADVDEAIDFLRFYAECADLSPGPSPARGGAPSAGLPTMPSAAGALSSGSEVAVSVGTPPLVGEGPGERYSPRGVVAVIPPWNFPLAIPCGMTAAALVTGNVVALKPAEQTPLIAGRLAAILHEAGVPAAALICLPGTGEVAGSALAGSPRVDMVAFTGSRAVGTLLFKQGAEVRPARGGLRHTLAEMGGKNPIVVFPDADLDEAVIAILRSAFGHANQKCSAASRVLIHAEIFDRLGRRLVEGARSLPAGPADDPSTLIPPLIDAEARARVAAAAAAARREGTVLLDDLDRPPAPATGPMLVEIGRRRAATARTTQEEIFGPVLALTPFRTLDEAVALANGTPYALTAGVFSRAPGTVRAMIGRLAAGNVYVNRPTTGARVGVEPFGGHKLSGTGPKAGGAEYLWAFVRRGEPRPGGALAAGDERIDADAVAPWPAGPGERAAILREAFAAVADQIDPGSIAAVAALLDRVEEIAAPQPTVAIPGQQTSVDWRTPRGCGLVLVDEGATTADLLALIAAALLAGNGLVILPDRARRPLAGDLLAALRRAGLPGRVACLAPEQVDFAALAALPALTFAAVDAGFEATHALGRLLAAASATPESPHLKALLTLADGPGPDEPGFLRRFALPKTVAVRTLHLGADLDMEIEASESVGGQ